MEDPDLADDWSIQEYSSEEQSGKLRWILNKGLNVGKKILVTGFVLSSAPFVLPPLVVVSVIGFACSVPSGILLASYACTDKLMSKLLPGSKPPLFSLDYGTVYNDEEVLDYENGAGEYLGLKGDFDMRKEEEKTLDDTWGNVEMRNDLIDEKKGNEVNEGKALVGGEHGQGGVAKDASDANEIAEENGHQEDLGEYEDEKEEEPVKETEVKIERVISKKEEKERLVEGRSDQIPADEMQVAVVDIAGDERSGGTLEERASVFEVSNIVVEVCENKDIEEDEELVTETRRLLERIREEGMTENRKEGKESLEKLSAGTEERDQKVDRKVEPLQESEDKTEEKKNGEMQKESSEMQETGHVKNVDTVPEEIKPREPVEGFLGKRKVDDILETEKSRGEVNGRTNVGSSTKEEPKPEKEIERPSVLQGGRATDNINSNSEQDELLNKEKEAVISTNADAREIADESGFDLYDKKNVAPQHYSDADYNTVEDASAGNKKSLETTDYMELPIPVGESERNDTAGISSKKDLGTASSKVSHNEKKMWQQVNAVSKIVGYKGSLCLHWS